MSVWATREQSIKFLTEWHSSRIGVIDQAVTLIDDLVDAYETAPEQTAYPRVCAVALLKAKSYALSSYSVILDGHGHEAGALLRPMIEYSELITYLRHFPDRAEMALEDKLPSAGNRAKAIGSVYEKLRKYLNEHASHLTFSDNSVMHLFDMEALRLRKKPHLSQHVLLTNVTILVVQILMLIQEAIISLEKTGSDKLISLAERHERLKSRAFDVFKLDEHSPVQLPSE
jgi:hypothetical protein